MKPSGLGDSIFIFACIIAIVSIGWALLRPRKNVRDRSASNYDPHSTSTSYGSGDTRGRDESASSSDDGNRHDGDSGGGDSGGGDGGGGDSGGGDGGGGDGGGGD